MDKEKIRCLLDEISKRLAEAKELLQEDKIIQLEYKNFRVDSSGWQQHTGWQNATYLESPTKDIWEYVSGVNEKLIGQQLFTWDAAVRETKKVGKQMPTDKEWSVLIDNNIKFSKLEFSLMPLSGFRNADGIFDRLTLDAYFWSSSMSDDSARRYCYCLCFDGVTVCPNIHNRANGLSVRCLTA